MLLRAVTLGLTLSVVSIAQGGAVVSLSPDPTQPGVTYPAGSTQTFDVLLSQTGTNTDQYLRMIQFDVNATDPALGLALPVVHNLDGFPPITPGDIQFFSFVGVPACDALASSCGNHQFVVDQLTSVVPPGPGIISATYGSATQLSQNALYQILLPGNGSPVLVGKIDVTMPAVDGTYNLDLVNAAVTNVDRGGQVRFGFGCQGLTPPCSDPITAWRASGASPALTGGSFDIEVGGTGCTTPADVVAWESVGFHGGGFAADWAMTIAPRNGSNEPTFAEPRFSGLSRLKLTFASGTVDAATAVPGNIQVVGTDAGGAPVNLGGVAIGVALQAGNTEMVISFTPALPRDSVYTVAIDGVETNGGCPAGGETERCMAAVLGDVNGDKRVAANDVGGTSSFVGVDPIDPITQPFHARADVNNDGRVRANDVGGISGLVGTDLRGATCPALP